MIDLPSRRLVQVYSEIAPDPNSVLTVEEAGSVSSLLEV